MSLTPCVYAALVWWFATGALLFLDRLPAHTFRWSFAGMTALLAAAGAVLYTSSADASVSGAYTAFTCAIVIWAWLEMSFLMGFITGPRTHACRPQCPGWRHFLHATQAIIYNDAATALLVGAVFAATSRAPNRVALWTLIILWIMRISAKLNLFLGVPNLGDALLPPHLQYLRSFFSRRPMNFLFPISITAATLASGWLLNALLHAGRGFAATSLALTGSLLVLALLEHWFMVLPLPSERLWSWALYAAARRKRGRHTPRMMLASESVRSSHNPPRSVRNSSAN